MTGPKFNIMDFFGEIAHVIRLSFLVKPPNLSSVEDSVLER